MTNSIRSPKTSAAAPAAAARGVLGRSVRMVLPGHRTGERPSPVLPSVAALGRSNVGKSSLLNALLGAKAARVSATPGRTQALYWYRVDDAFDVVDCPGYGFARAARADRERFSELIEDLLTGERPADLALLLVDARLEPQESDLSMALFLERAGVPTVVAATKWDGVKPSRRVATLRRLTAAFGTETRPLLPVSSETGESIHPLGRLLRERLTSPARRGPSEGALPGCDLKEP